MRVKHLPRVFQPILRFSIILFSTTILLFGVLNVQATIRSQQEIRQMQLLTLKQSCQNLESFLYGVKRLGLIFQSNSNLSALNVYNNYRYPHNIVYELSLFKPYINSLKSLGFVYTTSPYEIINDTIYTDAGVYSGERYLSLQCESNTSYEAFRTVLLNTTEAGFLRNDSFSSDYLLYILPMPSGGISSPGYFLFLLNRDEFIQSLSELNQKNGGDLYFFTPSGELFLYLGSSFDSFTQAQQSLSRGYDYTQHMESFQYESELYPFNVVQTIPQNTFRASFLRSIVLLVAICLLSLLFCTVILVVITKHTAEPLTSLVETLHTQDQLFPDSASPSDNEFDQIAASFQNLLSQKKQLLTTADSYAQMEEGQYCLYLLGLSGATDFSRNLLDKYAALFADQHFKLFVCVFRFDNAQTLPSETFLELQSQLHDTFSAQCKAVGYGMMTSLPGSLASVALCFLQKDVDELDYIHQLREKLYKQFHLPISCSVSHAVESMEQLPLAYRKAIKCFRYYIFLPNRCLSEQDIAHLDISSPSNESQVDAAAIIQAIVACNYANITHSCEIFFANIIHRSSLSDYKIAYFDLMAQLSKQVQKCAAADREVLFYQLETLYENCYEKPAFLEKKVSDFCCLLATTLYQHRTESLNSGLENVILNYINQHYTSPDLSLNTIAEALSFSPSYLTRYFKGKMGISLMQYIDQKRFEKSKQLLEGTTLSIQEVREQSGYTDPANFSRKFKQHEGVTPKQYRMLRLQQTDAPQKAKP